MTDVAKFTLELEGHPDEVKRVLGAMQHEYSAIEEEHRRLMDESYRMILGDRYRHPHGPFSSLRGKITLSKVDVDALGWH
jgi:predicted nuclease with TOPRIM domain